MEDQMMMTKDDFMRLTDEEFLQAVRAFVSTRWMKDAIASRNGKVCLMGAASLTVTGTVRHILYMGAAPAGSLVAQRLAQERLGELLAPVLSEQYPERFRLIPGRTSTATVVGFNDHPETRLDEVLAMLDKAIARTGG